LAQHQWRSVYLHTCGDARKILQDYEKDTKPFDVGKKLVAVDIKSITTSAAPRSYNAMWTETAVEAHQTKTTRWAGTFSVGRMRPKDMQAMLLNRVGLCVTAFNWSQQPEK
jgi:type IV secretory pathway TrbF-like protein